MRAVELLGSSPGPAPRVSALVVTVHGYADRCMLRSSSYTPTSGPTTLPSRISPTLPRARVIGSGFQSRQTRPLMCFANHCRHGCPPSVNAPDPALISGSGPLRRRTVLIALPCAWVNGMGEASLFRAPYPAGNDWAGTSLGGSWQGSAWWFDTAALGIAPAALPYGVTVTSDRFIKPADFHDSTGIALLKIP